MQNGPIDRPPASEVPKLRQYPRRIRPFVCPTKGLCGSHAKRTPSSTLDNGSTEEPSEKTETLKHHEATTKEPLR